MELSVSLTFYILPYTFNWKTAKCKSQDKPKYVSPVQKMCPFVFSFLEQKYIFKVYSQNNRHIIRKVYIPILT